MLFRIILGLLLVSSLVSCSGSRTTEGVNSTEGIELVGGDDDLLEIDERVLLSNDSGVKVDTSGIGSMALDNIDNEQVNLIETQSIPNDLTFDSNYREGEELGREIQVSPGAVGQSTRNYENYNSGGATSNYKVESNETLMLIAFKLYGDYSRWRELASLNQGKLGSNYQALAGTTIKYYSEGAGFSWNPSGEPYLIKHHDTLGKISNKVYGTFNRWRAIWDNNRPLIKDPDKIYTGFTIYYPVDGASSK